MHRSENYNTKQKDLILEVIKNKKSEFTVKEIYEEVKGSIGLTTIYRFIDKQVENGILNKTIGENNTTYYQYLETCNCSNHFYLKCNECGKLAHIDCECIEELTNHITKNHKFRPNKDHIIINGLCNNCYRNENKRRNIK